MVIVRLLLLFTLGEYGIFTVPEAILTIFGYWGIFKKCGAKPWEALVPFRRTYTLARCAGREPEGRVLTAADVINTVLQGLILIVPPGNTGFPVALMAAQFAVVLWMLIYWIRVFDGLALAFNRRKIWVVLWVFFQGICSAVWGWSKRFAPRWLISDFADVEEKYFDGSARGLDEGLTVDIRERIVRSFFGKKYLLRDIHMYIKPGRMVLLLGGSGAGKTTFLNAVNGYEKADAQIVLNGSNVYKEYKKMKYKVGFVPQQDLIRGSDTVLRTLTDAAALRLPMDFDQKERRERVDEVMKMFGLRPVQDSLVDKLSGGQRKRLSIAMEFISNPSLFILDEPDSGLDGVMARELMNRLRRIADQGKIVIVITHTPDRVVDLFDDVIVLAKDANRTGRLAFYGTIEEARKFFGRERMEEIVMCVCREEEGGEGRADDYISEYVDYQRS